MNKIEHHQKIVEFQNFMPETQCNELIEHFDKSAENWQEFCFYGSYGMNPSLPFDLDPTTKVNIAYLDEIRNAIQAKTEEVMGERLQNTAASVHKWVPGSFAEPHADNTDMDGNPTSWRQYKYVAILYMNEDFEGGELYFTQHGITIKPKTGSLVVFEPSADYLHGVHKIKSGNRFTILTSWDTAGAQYSEEFFRQKEIDVENAVKYSAERRDKIREQISKGIDVGE